MDLDTVSNLVNELLSAYATGLEYYTKWQRRKWQENHYSTHDKGRTSSSGSCGLSTSLGVAGPVIRQVYAEGVAALGERFSTGNKTCREKLYSNLERLQKRVDVLYEAMTAEHGPLPLAEIIRISEEVRRLTVAALADQFKRVSVGQLAPRPLPLMRQGRSQVARPTSNESTVKPAEDDVQTICHTTSSGKSIFQSEPPSPPLTPKMIPDDLQSRCTSSATITSGLGPRPKASVFSTFCPEAMKYQVDLRKAMPMQRTCRCGYDWHGWLAEDKISLTVKDGFHITPRFLGKSHREGGGFGCVLCTSSGKAGIYGDANALGEHINTAHTKWQILHDLDMAGRLGGAMSP